MIQPFAGNKDFFLDVPPQDPFSQVIKAKKKCREGKQKQEKQGKQDNTPGTRPALFRGWVALRFLVVHSTTRLMYQRYTFSWFG
jgi:hypothetical protein